MRFSLKLHNWQKAQDKVRDWEADNKITAEPAAAKTVQQACDAFLEDAQARNLQEPTHSKNTSCYFAACRLSPSSRGSLKSHSSI